MEELLDYCNKQKGCFLRFFLRYIGFYNKGYSTSVYILFLWVFFFIMPKENIAIFTQLR